jgi:hypothetical protein
LAARRCRNQILRAVDDRVGEALKPMNSPASGEGKAAKQRDFHKVLLRFAQSREFDLSAGE